MPREVTSATFLPLLSTIGPGGQGCEHKSDSLSERDIGVLLGRKVEGRHQRAEHRGNNAIHEDGKDRRCNQLSRSHSGHRQSHCIKQGAATGRNYEK